MTSQVEVTNKVTRDGIARIHRRLAPLISVVAPGEHPADIIGALLMTAVVTEKQRATSPSVDHREQFIKLVGEVYDRIDIKKTVGG